MPVAASIVVMSARDFLVRYYCHYSAISLCPYVPGTIFKYIHGFPHEFTRTLLMKEIKIFFFFFFLLSLSRSIVLGAASSLLTADISGNTQVNTSPMCPRGQDARSLVEENNKRKLHRTTSGCLGCMYFFPKFLWPTKERTRLAGRGAHAQGCANYALQTACDALSQADFTVV